MRNAFAHLRTVLTVLALGALLTGCASESPLGPSPVVNPAPTTPQAGVTADALTVRVLARASEAPISGAAVETDASRMLTNAAGIAILPVTAGEELEVHVSALGYEPMGAAAVLSPNERWTFYLQVAGSSGGTLSRR
jgi:hypothetical protein